MRRSTVAFAVLVGAAVIDLVACNTISGVGDFTFGTASSTASSGGGTSTSTGSGGLSASAGGAGGGLTVPCAKKTCPVSPDGGACCYENLTEFPEESGRCVDAPAATDGCMTTDVDGGRETRIECSRPGDCPDGLFCCGTIGGSDADGGTAWYTIVTCQATCDFSANQRVVCDPDGGVCPTNDGSVLACTQSMILQTGYFTCK